MKLKIIGIKDSGVLEKERIVLRVLDDDEVGRYAIFKAKKIGETKVSSRVMSAFWFQDQEVKKGDWVVVYTKTGLYSNKSTNGVTSHFFYWDKSIPIWGAADDSAILLHVDEWSFASV